MSRKKVKRRIPLRDNQIYRLDDSTKMWSNRFGDDILEPKVPDVLAEGREFWLWNTAVLSVSGNDVPSGTIVESEGYEHNTSSPFVSIRQYARSLEIETGNLVGKLSVRRSGKDNAASVSVEISSRFGEDFLRFIISDAHGFLQIDEFGSQTCAETGWEWLLGYLWATKLRAASGRLGIPKAYVSRTERTARPRGAIDPVDWAMPRTPGRWLSTMREHSFDTEAAKLFLAAHEVLVQRENVRNMGILVDLRGTIHQLEMATEGKSLPWRSLLKVPPFRNPFYRDYDEVIDLSKKVIRGWGADAAEDANSNAFLFDVSMLFEHFIRNRLKRAGLALRVKEADLLDVPHGGAFHNGRRRLIPDIVIDDSLGHCHVYDVKYKFWDEKYGVDRVDLFQLCTYVGRYASEGHVASCGFVYPLDESRLSAISMDDKNEGIAIKKNTLRIAGEDIPYYIVFLLVPRCEDGSEVRREWAARFDQCCEMLVQFFVDSGNDKS